jgi:AcrR family transcriptional regulator
MTPTQISKSAAPPSARGRRSTFPQWRGDLERRSLPPTDRHTAGQRKVLEASVELFAEKGYTGSSIRDIAAAAGMQSASLYNHFPYKEAILTELLVIAHDYHLDQLVAAVSAAEPDPREQLRAAVHSHVLTHCEYPLLALTVNYELRNLPNVSIERTSDTRSRLLSVLGGILDRGVEQGLFTSEGHHTIFMALASMGIDAARWFPYQTEIGGAELADDFAELALKLVAV